MPVFLAALPSRRRVVEYSVHGEVRLSKAEITLHADIPIHGIQI